MKTIYPLIVILFFLLTVHPSWGTTNSVSSLLSSSHQLSIPSTSSKIKVEWTKPPEIITGYSSVWDQTPDTEPDDTLDIPGGYTSSTESQTLYDGHIYFHIKALGNDNTWSETSHLGPMVIDKTPPEKVVNFKLKEEQGGSLTLSWINPDSEELFGILILMSAVNYPSSPKEKAVKILNENSSPLESRSYPVRNLETGKIYYFSIFTYDNVQDVYGGPNYSNPSIGSTVITGETNGGKILQVTKTFPQNDPAQSLQDSLADDSRINIPIEVFFSQNITSLSPAAIRVSTKPQGGGQSTTIMGVTSRIDGTNKIIFTPDTIFTPGKTGLRVNVTVQSGLSMISGISGGTLDGNYNGVEESSSVDGYSFHFFIRPAPSISNVSTQSGSINNSSKILNITGSNFLSNSEVSVAGATISSVRLISSSSLEVTLAEINQYGLFDITITNPDNQEYTMSNAFEIEAPVPTLSGVGIILTMFLMLVLFGNRDILSGAS